MKILVTGTSRGLGLAIASILSKQHEVTGCSRDVVKSPDTVEFSHIPNIDFHDTSTFNSLPLEEYDVLINNVGIAFDGLLAIQAEEKIKEVIEVNLVSTLVLIKNYVRSRLSKKSNGIIVNISSIIGIRGYAGLVSYSASKAGLDGATRALARELGPKGFRINSILPGYMETDMASSLGEGQKQQIIRRTPLGRFVKVEEVAFLIDFLISEKAKSVTGQCIVIDGGLTV